MTREEALRYLQAVSLMLLSADNKPIADFYEALNIAIEVLEQESKTGHWKRISMDLYVQHAMAYYQCSECGEKVIGEHNYCQFCGAKMAESEE